jgi:hypothetical protein
VQALELSVPVSLVMARQPEPKACAFLFQLNMCCPTVVICAILSAVVAQLVVLRWRLDVADVVFRRSIIFSFVSLLCCLLCLLEYCLVAWLLGAVVLSRVVGTAC